MGQREPSASEVPPDGRLAATSLTPVEAARHTHRGADQPRRGAQPPVSPRRTGAAAPDASLRRSPASDHVERDPAAVFADTLADAGLRAALGYLNGRTRHRFTGVYRFEPPLLRRVCLFDRENPELAAGADAALEATYCSLVGRDRAPFATADATADARLVAHPARATVLAYCGVPLLAPDGRCIGSLCHFDVRPRLVPATELALFEQVAPLVCRVVEASMVAPQGR